MRVERLSTITLTFFFTATLLLCGYSITFAADPVPPIHYLPFNEGTGDNVSDSITGAVLTGVNDDTSLNWCRGDIKDYANKWFLKSGKNFESKGVVEGDLIADDLSQYTFTFLTRVTDNGEGAILNPISSSLHFRFYGGTWDIAAGVVADPAYVKYNTWVRVTFVQTLTDQYVYVDRDLAGQYSGNRTLPAGIVRIGAFTSTGPYYYPGEYADIKIFDTALTNVQIGQLCDDDGPESDFLVYSDGSDFGGIFKREEHEGVFNSIVSVENGKYKHWFNGDSSCGAVSMLIPPGNNSLWFSAEFFYPSSLTANHDLGSTAQTIAIYDDMGKDSPIAILLLYHDAITQELTLGRLEYRNTDNGTTTVVLDGRAIGKDTFHKFELNYNSGPAGSVAFYLNGEELLSVSGNFDLGVAQVMYGPNLGIHPEAPGDHIYSDNLYVSEYRDSDGDGINDNDDNCPAVYNPGQEDGDSDGIGSACDDCDDTIDTDGDGTSDCLDLCDNDTLKVVPGVCGCGVADTDTDGDLTEDCIDECVDDPDKILEGICGCGIADTDTDSDGTADCNDECVDDPDKILEGDCGCGIADEDLNTNSITDCLEGQIHGTISGLMKSFVTVELWTSVCGSNELVATVITGATGSYSFTDIENGVYAVIPVELGDYASSPRAQRLTISDDFASGVDFTTSSARFFDNGDGTITDLLTDLIWMQNANCVQLQDFDTAVLFALGVGAYNGGCNLSDGSEWGDWRLPTKEELQSLGTNPPTTWDIDYPSAIWTMPSAPFTNVASYWYWSNTEFTTNYIWVTRMSDGYSNIFGKVGEVYVWPVKR